MVKKKPSGKPLDELLDDALQIKKEATPDTGNMFFDEGYDDDYGYRPRTSGTALPSMTVGRGRSCVPLRRC